MIGLSYGNFQAVTTTPFSFGNALQFDGVNDYVSFSDLTLNSDNAWTLSFWFKGQNSIGILGNSANTGFIQTIQTDGRVNLNTIFGIGGQITFNNPIRTTTDWYHYFIVADSSGCRCYVNGTESSSGSQVIGSVSGSANQIGRRSTGTHYINGIIDEFAILNGTKGTAQNAIDLYNGGNGANFETIMGNSTAYWRMNGSGTDTTAIDETGNYNGTLNNFPTSGMWVAH